MIFSQSVIGRGGVVTAGGHVARQARLVVGEQPAVPHDVGGDGVEARELLDRDLLAPLDALEQRRSRSLVSRPMFWQFCP
jgi:hypothetical protein